MSKESIRIQDYLNLIRNFTAAAEAALRRNDPKDIHNCLEVINALISEIEELERQHGISR
jgi:hypothetical protein